MTLKEIAHTLGLAVKTGHHLLDREITGGYAGDMLSDVLAHAGRGNIWVTLQTHANVVAVASTKELAAIIIVEGRTPAEETLRKAEEEGIPIMISDRPTFSVVCTLGKLGIEGHERV